MVYCSIGPGGGQWAQEGGSECGYNSRFALLGASSVVNSVVVMQSWGESGVDMVARWSVSWWKCL